MRQVLERRQLEWRPFSYGREVFDLSHLHPRTRRYEQPGQGDKPARIYVVDVIFSLHCFTRGAKQDEVFDPELFYGDDRETRIFDFQRYELSKRLPEIVACLGESKCYHTGRGNFFSVELMSDDGDLVEYDIFFTVSRSAQRGVLNLFVQSAYVRDQKHWNRPHLKPIAFHVILFNVLNGKPINVPK